MPTRSSSRASFAALTASVSLGIALFFSLYSLVPVTRSDAPELGSLYVGVLMACVLGVQVFAPMLVRRLSLRPVLSGAALLLGVGALLSAVSDAVPLMLAGAVAGGVGFGVLIVVGAQGVALIVPPGRLGRSLGLYGAISVTSSALGSAGALQLALTFGPLTFALGGAVAGIVSAALAMLLPGGIGARSFVGQQASDPRRLLRALTTGVPWMLLGLLLVGVVLLSFGLTAVPAIALPVSGALIVLLVQSGNALGRWLSAEAEERFGSAPTALAGALLMAAGTMTAACSGTPAVIAVAAVGIGGGVGMVQTVSLHGAMRSMPAGRASVVWNLTFDSGLWVGGVAWGLVLAVDSIRWPALAVAATAVLIGVITALRLRAPAGRH